MEHILTKVILVSAAGEDRFLLWWDWQTKWANCPLHNNYLLKTNLACVWFHHARLSWRPLLIRREKKHAHISLRLKIKTQTLQQDSPYPILAYYLPQLLSLHKSSTLQLLCSHTHCIILSYVLEFFSPSFLLKLAHGSYRRFIYSKMISTSWTCIT